MTEVPTPWNLTPPADHSYVNWRVKATYSDDSTENFPQNDWYKTWSTCYYDDGNYGGVHATAMAATCPVRAKAKGFLPSIAGVDADGAHRCCSWLEWLAARDLSVNVCSTRRSTKRRCPWSMP